MSRIALLTLANDKVRQRAIDFIRSAPVNARVEIKEAKRSLDQNALMWARLAEVSRQVEWYGAFLPADDWKDIFTASLRKARVVPGIDAGTYVPLGMRTSDMTKAEMRELLDLIDAFAAERGVTFHDSEAA